MPNYNQPMFQQALQRHGAKALMRGRKPRTQPLLSKLVQADLARKDAFASLGQRKQRADLSHKMRSFEQNQWKSRLAEEKAQLPWEIGIGAGSAIFSAIEGRRRARAIAAQEARKDARHKETIDALRGIDNTPRVPWELAVNLP